MPIVSLLVVWNNIHVGVAFFAKRPDFSSRCDLVDEQFDATSTSGAFYVHVKQFVLSAKES